MCPTTEGTGSPYAQVKMNICMSQNSFILSNPIANDDKSGNLTAFTLIKGLHISALALSDLKSRDTLPKMVNK